MVKTVSVKQSPEYLVGIEGCAKGVMMREGGGMGVKRKMQERVITMSLPFNIISMASQFRQSPERLEGFFSLNMRVNVQRDRVKMALKILADRMMGRSVGMCGDERWCGGRVSSAGSNE